MGKKFVFGDAVVTTEGSIVATTIFNIDDEEEGTIKSAVSELDGSIIPDDQIAFYIQTYQEFYLCDLVAALGKDFPVGLLNFEDAPDFIERI
jgi:hypothetical protein